MRVVLVALFILYGASAQKLLRLGLNEKCRNETEPWVCKKSNDCKGLKNGISSGKIEICTFIANQPVICCPPSVDDRISTPDGNKKVTTVDGLPKEPAKSGKKAEEKCREYAQYVFRVVQKPILLPGKNKLTKTNECGVIAQPLIVGGTPAKLKEFPHMALIGLKNETKILWFCGGSLISPRFILTAAHCGVSKIIDRAVVRLGELDISSNNDGAKPQDVNIVEVFDHPQYRYPINYHDISLLKMEHDISLTPLIRPLCLHTNLSINSDQAIASGWGHTTYGGNSSNILQKVNFTITDDERCKNIYLFEISKLPRGTNPDIMFCAGEQGKDTCQGDSGGPLQIPIKDPYCMYSLIGITSFGTKCGTNAPGGYTRVSHYVPWIESIVWPGN